MSGEHSNILKELARSVALAEQRLAELEGEIREIGQPAAQNLNERLEALKIEEEALKRNLHHLLETGEEPGSPRWQKVENLLEWIQRQEDSLGHDADFLHQSSPSSPELVAQAGTRLVHLVLGALKRVVGDHHPLGMSAFVNHTHEALVKQYGLK